MAESWVQDLYARMAEIKTDVGNVSESYQTVVEETTNLVMDAIISNTAARTAYKGLMMSTSLDQAKRARVYGDTHNYQGAQLAAGASQVATSVFMGVIGLTDIALLTSEVVLAAMKTSRNGTGTALAELYEQALSVPNIEGIPILSSTVQSVREVEVGSQMMIVQNQGGKKQYWTDNAVPKLKEWTVDGYITISIPVIDALYVIKPTLEIQEGFLDRCAISRRPVLFKDNRGNFQLVQIMSLKTSEEASYNNAIKVDITLREYKPYEVNASSTLINKADSIT